MRAFLDPVDFAAQETVDFIGRDDPVIDGSEPTRHDDANGSSMIQPRCMIGE